VYLLFDELVDAHIMNHPSSITIDTENIQCFFVNTIFISRVWQNTDISEECFSMSQKYPTILPYE